MNICDKILPHLFFLFFSVFEPFVSSSQLGVFPYLYRELAHPF